MLDDASGKGQRERSGVRCRRKRAFRVRTA